jgi:hypothetical protein
MTKLTTHLLVGASLLLLTHPISAQTITPLVLEGDAVAGVGNVTIINNLAINDAGEWIVEVDTDGPTDSDAALIKNGALYLREFDPLASPPGATISSFDAVNLNNAGNSGWNFFLDGTAGTGDDSGIYFNASLLLQESAISTSPDFSPGTPYIGFLDTEINNDGNGKILVIASVDDPAIASSVDRAIVILDHDGAGNLVSETVFVKEGDILPGQTEAVADVDTNPWEFAFNDAGSILFCADLAGATATDGALYVDNTLIAQEGSPSPVPGRNYEFILDRARDMSNSGAVVFKANLDGATTDDDVIILNGAVFVREGDALPATGGFLLENTGLTSGHVEVDNAGNVLWYAEWNDPDTDVDPGLFLNDQLLVQEGVTTIGGVIVDAIANGQDNCFLSNNGQYAIFEATLIDGTNGAFLIELSTPVSLHLSNLQAVVEDRVVALSWVTTAEIDHDGFHVERSTDGRAYTRVTDALVRGRSPYRFVDDDVLGNRTYFYRVVAVDHAGVEATYGPVSLTTPPWSIRVAGLSFARPNPFVSSTDLRFTIDRPGRVELSLFDVSGRLVRTLVSGELDAGEHVAIWDGRDDRGRPMPAGTYFSRLNGAGASGSRKITYLGN